MFILVIIQITDKKNKQSKIISMNRHNLYNLSLEFTKLFLVFSKSLPRWEKILETLPEFASVDLTQTNQNQNTLNQKLGKRTLKSVSNWFLIFYSIFLAHSFAVAI